MFHPQDNLCKSFIPHRQWTLVSERFNFAAEKLGPNSTSCDLCRVSGGTMEIISGGLTLQQRNCPISVPNDLCRVNSGTMELYTILDISL
jgi:hypothetical protein